MNFTITKRINIELESDLDFTAWGLIVGVSILKVYKGYKLESGGRIGPWSFGIEFRYKLGIK